MPVEVRRAVLAIAATVACGCAVLSGSGGSRATVATPAPREGAARDALARFIAAVDAGRWTDAYALLSARWRARVSPARLAADFAAAGPVGREATARTRALLAAGARLAIRNSTAILEVGQGKAAMVVEEEGAWRVDALE